MNLEDVVTIKECHSIPDLVGREAKIVAMASPDFAKYPIQVVLTGEPIKVKTLLGEGETNGPFTFWEDELELKTDIPEDIKKAFDEGDK